MSSTPSTVEYRCFVGVDIAAASFTCGAYFRHPPVLFTPVVVVTSVCCHNLGLRPRCHEPH